ncbi:MAG: TolC family protein [Pyrinomonadaceae bacterium]|nr:TolC family protein [Pyrinomonadaceae bacterium]
MKKFSQILWLNILFIILLCGSSLAQTEKPQIAKVIETKTVTEDKKDVEKVEKSETNVLPSTILVRSGIDSSNALTFSLNDAIKKALENNNDVEIAKNEVKIAENQLRSIRGFYDPSFNLSPTFSRSSSTGSSASNDFRFDSDMGKNLKRGGGSYQIFYNTSQSGRNSANNTAFNQTSSLGNSSSITYLTSLGIRYTQPLFRGRQIDQTRQQIKIQKKRLEQSDSDFRLRTIQVISQVQQAYWDLVFALRDQQNRVDNLNLTKENLRRVEAQIAAGTVAPLAKAEVSTELANREFEVISATEQVSQAENRLKQLILKDVLATEWNASIVPTDKPAFSDEPIKFEDALKEATSNRPELRRLKLEREINSVEVEFAKEQVKPKIDFVSSFSLQGLSLGNVNTSTTNVPLINSAIPSFNADSFLYRAICGATPNIPNCLIPPISVPGSPNYFKGGYGRSFANLFRSDAPNYSFGVTISFPLKNTKAKADLAIAEIQQNQIDARTRTQEQTILVEVRNAVQSVESARQRVIAARKARENAEIQLNGERKLYEVGRSTTFLLFQRENALTNARNSEIRAETDYNKSLSELQRVTFSTFRINRIELETPTVK